MRIVIDESPVAPDASAQALPDEIRQNSLLQLLSNPLLLYHTIAYLPVSTILDLAATSRSFRALVNETKGVFRHLDLTQVKSAQFEIDGIDRGGETWRNAQLDENLTEDEYVPDPIRATPYPFYAGPLRGVISSLQQRNVLQDVQTLILDGLPVTADLVSDILIDPMYNVRILSLRECQHLNKGKVQGALRYACRRTRPEGTPRLKALYIFTARDAPALPVIQTVGNKKAHRGQIGTNWNHKSHSALSSSIRNDEGLDPWYDRKGKMVAKPQTEEWGSALQACEDIISFDAVLCRGPRHVNSPAYGKRDVHISSQLKNAPSVATVSLGGCASCGAAPEGFNVYGDKRLPKTAFPLLTPIPLHRSSWKAAAQPQSYCSEHAPVTKPGSNSSQAKFIPRCLECLKDRHCMACNRWWCEACYRVPDRDGNGGLVYYGDPVVVEAEAGIEAANAAHEAEFPAPPKIKARVSKSCWECDINCDDCIGDTQKWCKACGGGYCIIHNEGSTLTLCDCTVTLDLHPLAIDTDVLLQGVPAEVDEAVVFTEREVSSTITLLRS